ncbi:SOS response-associated peptidase [uncultured Jatrophihabitans sp.]|uniref:SOS response-associated peptidase n=1 Tax=uncultured Jatrophihabitans sp. TaxID=1610747 RepID=UPI0035CA6A5F
MCGRYVNAVASGDLVDEFDVDEVLGEDVPPSWNIAPTDPVRAVLDRHAKDAAERTAATSATSATSRQLRTLRWGLVPSWSKSHSGGAKMINARSETVAQKPAFKAAAARRRCLLPAQGYYEWQRVEGGKIPFFLHEPDGAVLAMAGLYEIWRDDSLPADDPQRFLWTCTVITRPATDTLGEIHDRCPVLVPAELRAQWLDCTGDDAAIAQRLLAELPEPILEPRLVSKAVGSVRNNGPQLIEPVDPQPVAQQLTIDV